MVPALQLGLLLVLVVSIPAGAGRTQQQVSRHHSSRPPAPPLPAAVLCCRWHSPAALSHPEAQRSLAGPGQGVGEHKAVGHQVDQGLGGAGVNVLSEGRVGLRALRLTIPRQLPAGGARPARLLLFVTLGHCRPAATQSPWLPPPVIRGLPVGCAAATTHLEQQPSPHLDLVVVQPVGHPALQLRRRPVLACKTAHVRRHVARLQRRAAASPSGRAGVAAAADRRR